MDEILDNFEFGIDENRDSEEISETYNLCVAKLEALLATNKIETNENIDEPTTSETYNEVSSIKNDQENLCLAIKYAFALRELFRSNDPQFEEYKKIFRHLFYELKKNVNETRYLEEALETFKYKITELKMTVKNKQSELDEVKQLRRKEANKQTEKYKKKLKSINNWQGLIREMIIASNTPLGDDPDLVELLAKYRKTYNPVLE
ncbi:uncharacterized protein LOC123293771 [Chrysoperla carnea]|uniref:uncharacterized protein LOC123293771 n=1 Tax=Chrysoperla carnea TaxID=189513 RepID=UPI001D06A3D2|nr:uncharacterized protein LOC123293771 [Chrysoperla carnea]